MKKDFITSEQLEKSKQSTYYIISSLIEHCEEIEQAYMSNIFKSFLSPATEVSNSEIDSLYLLWTVVSETKAVKKLKDAGPMSIEQLEETKKRTYDIMTSLVEHCEEIETAFIANVFKSLLSSATEISKAEIDSLYLFWTVISEAKIVRKMKDSVDMIHALVNS